MSLEILIPILPASGTVVSSTIITFAFLLLLTALLVAISRISFSVVLKGIKPVFFILIFTTLINIFLTEGEGAPLLAFWVIKIYKEGIIRAVFMSVRVIILIIGTSMFLTYTTSPISLTDGIESLLKPLKKIGVPVHLFAMMMTIALRFIPTLVEETEKIMNAQKSRGADFTSGSIVKRAKALIPLLVPLFVSSFKRAEELATAMECRCYRGDKNRTKFNELKYKSRDFGWMLFSLLIFASVILLRVLPYKFEIDNLIYDIMFYRI